jgi:hypothetical protein
MLELYVLVDGGEYSACHGGLIYCNQLRKWEEESRPVLSKVLVVVVVVGMGQGIVLFIGTMAR